MTETSIPRRSKSGQKRRRTITGVLTYAVLLLFAAIVLFPFIVALSASLKESEDVFNYPPTLIPQVPATTSVESLDEDAPLYLVDIEGEQREYALVENGVPIGIYSRVSDAEDESLQFQLDDQLVTGTGEPITVLVNGREREREIGTAIIDGDTVEVVRFRSAVAGLFADPDDLDATVVQNVNDAVPVKEFDLATENFSNVLELQRLDRSLTNTFLVTILVVVGQVFTSIMGGYAFARLYFAGRDRLFLIYLGSIMIPFVVLIVPLHQLMVSIGWINSLTALVVPFLFTAYGTFLMRQFFVGIPRSLEDAAIIDGATRWTILWRIIVPLSKPPIATLSAFAFLYAWNSFVWPLVAINSGNLDNRVLPLALQVLGGRAADSPNLILAGVMIAIIPPITAFVLAQRHFVEGVASQGLKD